MQTLTITPRFLEYLITCCKKHGLRFVTPTESNDHVHEDLRRYAVAREDLPCSKRDVVLMCWEPGNDGMPMEKAVKEIMFCKTGKKQ